MLLPLAGGGGMSSGAFGAEGGGILSAAFGAGGSMPSDDLGTAGGGMCVMLRSLLVFFWRDGLQDVLGTWNI